MLYNYPAPHVQNWGVAFDKDQLRTIKEETSDWDIDAYLPQETLEWCKGVLQTLRFDPVEASKQAQLDPTTPFLNVYLQLRAHAQLHIQNGFEPQLSLLSTPVGARNWQVSLSYENKKKILANIL